MAGQALIVALVGILASSHEVVGFVAPLQARSLLTNVGRSWSSPIASAAPRPRLTRCRMQAEGEELVSQYAKLTKLQVVDEALGICKYEFNLEAPGSMTNRINHGVTRAVKEKADFPGHMRGQIPLQMMGELKKFVVEQVMNDSIVAALEAHGLMGADGEGTEADMNTDIEDLLEVFKPGKSLFFTCTMDTKLKPKADGPVEDAALSDT